MELTDQTVAPASQPQNLTDWKNPPTLAQLQEDLRQALPIHDEQKNRVNEWLDNLHVTGTAAIPLPKKGEPARSTVQPKLIRQQAEWRYPALSQPFLSTDNLFKVTPVTGEDKKAARQNALVLNNQWNTKIGKVKFIDEYVRAAVDEGTVVARMGWAYSAEPYEEQVPDCTFYEDPTFQPTIDFLVQMQAENPSLYDTDVPDELKQAFDLSQERGVAVRPEVVGYKWVTKERVLCNHPTVEICDLRNVVFDPTCNGDIKKANFAIYSFETSLAELRKDTKYKNLELIDTNTTTVLSAPDHVVKDQVANFKFADKPRQKLVAYEYWGKWDINGDGTTKSFVATWVGNTLIRLEENPYPDKELPFVVVSYLPKRKSLYGEPDGELLKDNQKIAGAVTRGMIDLMAKSANGQTGMRRDMLDATNRRKWEKGLDYEFNGNVDPRQGVYQHTYPEIPQSAFLMLSLQNQQAEALTGVRSFAEGVTGNSLGDVAAGVRGALDAASKRELDILQRLKQGVIEIGRKMIAMNQELLSEKEVVRVTDEEFVTVRRDDLAGNFDLALDISTAEEDNARATDLGFLLQTVGPNAPPDLTNIILADICRLRKMPDLAEKLENYKPQPDPLQQKLQQLEIAKLEVEIAKLQAEAQKIMTDAGLNQAKVGTEIAKAKQLTAQADITNLDFVEQESGVKQEREKELHGEQARAQGRLKMLEFGMNQQLEREKMNTDLLKEYMKSRAKAKSK